MPQHTDERKKNSMMNDNFSDVITESMKNPQHRCNHCEHQSIKNAAKEQLHLKACDAFIKEQERRKQEFLSKISTQLSITFLIRSLSQAQVAQAYRAAAMSVYMTNLSFNHFENSYVIAHHQALSPGCKPSHHKLVRNKLLDETYETVKLKVIQKLNASKYLSFFTDETINIRKERIINLCCHVSSTVTSNEGGFHLKATAGVAEKMSAAVQAE
jgi:hypothetical protein